ncbi:MAG: tRNA-dihydrouridine synthase family protein [Victivallales bacterium]
MKIYPDNSIVLAPLAGFTDLPYRSSARRHGCLFAFTEMIDAGSLVFGHGKTLSMLKRGENETWLGVQIVGSEHEILKKAARIICQHDVNIIDFNLGCPARKVIKKGEGAALARKTEEAIRAFEIIVMNSQVPVTVKTRIIDEDDPEPTIHLVKRLVEAGAAAVTLHGRVMSKVYSGDVKFNIISEVRKNVKTQLIANGGIFSFSTCETLRNETGCGCVMIARGAMGNPWIFEEIRDGSAFNPPTPDDLADEIGTHVAGMAELCGEEIGVRISRKLMIDYVKGRGYPGELRNSVCKIKTLQEMKPFLDNVRLGPTPRYSKWIEANPDAPRRLMV